MADHLPPISLDDPINQQLLRVSEDQLSGFYDQPFAELASRAGLDMETVCQRLRAMLNAKVIRRIRQTVLANKLAPGALVAWHVPADRLDAAFQWMSKHDPFTGHVVIRSTDADTPGSKYRLWTTLKVPQGFSMANHCDVLARHTGAVAYRLMPAHKMFALGVGHMRRRDLHVGDKTPVPGRMIEPGCTPLDATQWRVLASIKRELDEYEISDELWANRAAAIDMPIQTYLATAHQLDELGVIGRFSTFLEHVKPVAGNERVTRFNALFHWRVPAGLEIEAGLQVGRFQCMTHAYWREAGPEFANVNLMGVIHGMDKSLVLAHKQAIDDHLRQQGIDVGYTAVFWGGRSEIKPSEIMPDRYEAWCRSHQIDPVAMREK